MKNRIKVGVVLGGMLLAGLIGPAGASASTTSFGDHRATCSSGLPVYSFTNQAGESAPYQWRVMSNTREVLRSGEGVVMSGQEVKVSTDKYGSATTFELMWPRDNRDWQSANTRGGNQTVFNQPVCFALEPVVVAPGPVAAPVSPKAVVTAVINGHSYIVAEQPSTLREIQVKIIWLLSQLYGL